MKKKINIQEEIDKTLASADAFERFEGSPFLATRIQAKMENSENMSQGIGSYIFSLKLIPLAIGVIFAVNILTIYFNYNTSNSESRDTELLSFAEEYDISTTAADYVNPNNE